jgi:hypothetical protein
MKILSLIILFTWIIVLNTFAAENWEFRKIYETPPLTKRPFFLMTATDLDGNGSVEIVVSDFGKYGNKLGQWGGQLSADPTRNLIILEWDKSKLKEKWRKQWDLSKSQEGIERLKYFMGFKASQLVAWKIGKKTIVETIPNYLSIEWSSGQYSLKEQFGPFNEKPLIGSMALPWLSPSCYKSFPNLPSWPRECLVGIRDYLGNGNVKYVTLFENKNPVSGDIDKVIRIRSSDSSFKVESELPLQSRDGYYYRPLPIDIMNSFRAPIIIFTSYTLTGDKPQIQYLLEYKKVNNSYFLQQIHEKLFIGFISKDLQDNYLETYDLPEVYLGQTQVKNKAELWGYRRQDLGGPNSDVINFNLILRKILIKADLDQIEKDDIEFDHHERYLGVGYFSISDIDKDGLDEILFVEQTGVKEFSGHESVHYSNVKDYIHVLKWTGNKYESMWISPPYENRGVKFLVADVERNGRNQLVVMVPSGRIQVWEMK